MAPSLRNQGRALNEFVCKFSRRSDEMNADAEVTNNGTSPLADAEVPGNNGVTTTPVTPQQHSDYTNSSRGLKKQNTAKEMAPSLRNQGRALNEFVCKFSRRSDGMDTDPEVTNNGTSPVADAEVPGNNGGAATPFTPQQQEQAAASQQDGANLQEIVLVATAIPLENVSKGATSSSSYRGRLFYYVCIVVVISMIGVGVGVPLAVRDIQSKDRSGNAPILAPTFASTLAPTLAPTMTPTMAPTLAPTLALPSTDYITVRGIDDYCLSDYCDNPNSDFVRHVFKEDQKYGNCHTFGPYDQGINYFEINLVTEEDDAECKFYSTAGCTGNWIKVETCKTYTSVLNLYYYGTHNRIRSFGCSTISGCSHNGITFNRDPRGW